MKSGCTLWQVDEDMDRAINIAKEHMPDGPEPDATIGAKSLHNDTILSFNLGYVTIRHTVLEWLEIYSYEEKYLGCSEY